ncbi:MFS transporter [Streptomyces sp. NPDC091272]|uniref:MFS transporter n=1 Tax=Streptomyces sp. NPDC091272 TaxID=3365981 RepID=UPI0037F244DE
MSRSSSASPSSSPPAPWRKPDFRRLWFGQTFSQLGAHASQVTLPLLAVVTLGADAGQLGLLRAVEQAPILLFSLIAGAWVDRGRTREVMVLADFGRALALAAIPLAHVIGGLGLPLLFVVAFLVGALSVFFDVACQASLPRLVAREELVRGNSALEGSRSAAQTGGPALGGALVSLLTAPAANAVAALLFAVSFVSIRRVRRDTESGAGRAGDGTDRAGDGTGRAGDETSRAGDGSDRPGGGPPGGRGAAGKGACAVAGGRREPAAPGLWPRVREGLQLVHGDPLLRSVAVATALFQFSFAALMTVLLLFLPRGLHLSGTAVGLVLAAVGPGALAGSLLAARLPGRWGYGRVLVGAAAVGDGVMLCVPALRGSAGGTVAVLVSANFLFGMCGQLVNVSMMAVRQARTPVRLQGRVVATINVVGMGLTPLGSLLGGQLAQCWGLRTGLLVAAAALTLSPVFMALSPLRRVGRSLPTARL